MFCDFYTLNLKTCGYLNQENNFNYTIKQQIQRDLFWNKYVLMVGKNHQTINKVVVIAACYCIECYPSSQMIHDI